ncbi:homospermidine synthase [Pseudomonas marginalis]|uniref:saccharopine dehydrogenase C-terminal domain-containing protein n=1 Tax=Pseudomonas marginalis TaxID=298 RepID=UPI00209EC832|nr:saccharopine dehydrogenase C-terminal domain-containing protein [Pseudomonas marginalis]MCP1508405.1 homospermidine synthase [Pseudomonas marginalis]MCP1525909.1 homospermidine synthase [Pseudomonas marginalis]MDQ0498777.1 homospermidine synthase [Pseudomonas marginalis]
MNVVLIGYGTIASALMPNLLSEFEGEIKCLKVIDPYGVKKLSADFDCPVVWVTTSVTKENLDYLLSELDSDSFLINLSVDVSSVDLVSFCQKKGARYIDTCIEPWAGHYVNADAEPADRTNYALREAMLALKAECQNGPTAIVAHGANPGLVSHFAKQALLNIRDDIYGISQPIPQTRQQWAKLSADLGVKTIHIAEHDTQVAKLPKRPGEFVNTWSIDGFIGEGCQPAELGWGTHELRLPPEGQRHTTGRNSAIYLNRPGASVRLKTWTPAFGPCLGFLITHNEAVSLSDYLTCFEGEQVTYRPTVNYAYHPCSDAILSIHELSGCSWHSQPHKRILQGRNITSGGDYLGVLLMGHEKNAYWFGSYLENSAAQKLNPESSATSLQVVAGVISGMKWAIANPCCGIVEAEEMDFRFVLDNARPYLGEMLGEYTDWSPVEEDKGLFSIASSDKWQFENFME